MTCTLYYNKAQTCLIIETKFQILKSIFKNAIQTPVEITYLQNGTDLRFF